jgi:hypothetical protein
MMSDSRRRSAATPEHDFLVGMHGTLRLHSWLDPHSQPDAAEIDAEGFIETRLESLGCVPGSYARSFYAESGGDWVQDGEVRELAWIHGWAPDEEDVRPPVLAAALILNDVLDRAGTHEFVAMHAVVPLQLGPPRLPDLAAVGVWFEADDPGSRCSFVASLTVASEERQTRDLTDAFREITRVAAGSGIVSTDRAVAEGAAAEIRTGHARRMVQGIVSDELITGRARTWSMDLAAWLIEVVADAARMVGVNEPALISVARTSTR